MSHDEWLILERFLQIFYKWNLVPVPVYSKTIVALHLRVDYIDGYKNENSKSYASVGRWISGGL
jgi:hypothetical protein